MLDERPLQPALHYGQLDQVIEAATERANGVVAAAGGADTVQPIHIERADAVAVALERKRVEHAAGGMIIGRAAAAEQFAVVRLGSVARRVLRKAQAPVVVCPPNLDPAVLGGGPLLALTNLDQASVTACEFVRDMADTLDRPWVIAHAIGKPEDYGHYYLDNKAHQKRRDNVVSGAQQRLENWCEQHGFTGDSVSYELMEGGVIEVAQQTAQRLDSPLIAAGSRKLNAIERFLYTSVGSELAAVARRPVAIIPPQPKK